MQEPPFPSGITRNQYTSTTKVENPRSLLKFIQLEFVKVGNTILGLICQGDANQN